MSPKPNKIFISHKSINKPIARRLSKNLKMAGFHSWLDEDVITAGVELERSIYQGFVESCAAVFIITPEYKNHGYLASEVNYALSEKRKKGDDFSIIVINYPGEKGASKHTPSMLTQHLSKKCESEIDAFHEVVKALPIKPGVPIRKD